MMTYWFVYPGYPDIYILIDFSNDSSILFKLDSSVNSLKTCREKYGDYICS